MGRDLYGKRWQPGPQGGHYLNVDPKHARAALRAETPASVHRTKWLCLDCLKTLQDFHTYGRERRTCPSCGGTAKRVGVRFRPPKLRDFRAWKATITWLETGRWPADDITRLRQALDRRRGIRRH
ncbi:hypothetical protein [Gymnodinialimonas sp.]